MSPDLNDLLKRAANHEFDPKKLGAIPITGVLKKARDPKHCILVMSSTAAGDVIVEIALDDVVKHVVEKEAQLPGDRVTLHVKPSAILTTSLAGKLATSIVPAFIVTAAFGQAPGEPTPSVPWREIVTPFSRLDVMLNLVDAVAWTECRARGKAQCEALFPPGPDRDRCITERYIECGAPPRLRVDERVLEQLVGLLKGSVGP